MLSLLTLCLTHQSSCNIPPGIAWLVRPWVRMRHTHSLLLTLIRVVKPGNVDAVDLVHGACALRADTELQETGSVLQYGSTVVHERIPNQIGKKSTGVMGTRQRL